MLSYESLNLLVYNKVPRAALKILDIGCGTGMLGRALKEQNNDRVVYGVTYSEEEYQIAKNNLDKVFIVDINKGVPAINSEFNCIIFSHILEHTLEPENVLINFLKFLQDDGLVIIALPNVLQYKQRFQFLKGKFRYSKTGGLMDITHFRFFDWQTAQELIKNAGLQILSKDASGNFPLPVLRKLVPPVGRVLDRVALKCQPGLFAFQFIFVAQRNAR